MTRRERRLKRLFNRLGVVMTHVTWVAAALDHKAAELAATRDVALSKAAAGLAEALTQHLEAGVDADPKAGVANLR